MIDNMTIQAAKAVDINEIVDSFGWSRYGAGLIKCPSPCHDDSTPSCSYNSANNTFRCFGCGTTFDTIGMYQNLSEKVDGRKVFFPKAVNEILQMDGGTMNSAAPTGTVPSMNQNSQNQNNRSQKKGSSPYDIVLGNSRPLTGYELNYLHSRGIMLYDSYVYQKKVYTVQNIDKALQAEVDKQKIQQLNDIKDKGTFYKGIAPILKANRIQVKHNYWQGVNSIIYLIDYDYYDDDGLQGTALFLKDTERHMAVQKSLDEEHIKKALGTSDFIWIAEGMGDKKTGDIYIVEGVEDSLSYTMNKKRSVSLNSAANVHSFIEYLDHEYMPVNRQRFIISLDHDREGQKATGELIKFFDFYNQNHPKRKYDYAVCDYPKQYHDINDYWKAKVFQ